MLDREQVLDEILNSLRSLVQHSFPKTCSCGRVYKNLEEFLARTRSLSEESGLFKEEGLKNMPVQNLLRHCDCGSTLLAVFNNRRDTSEKGERLRQLFDLLLGRLEKAGVAAPIARQELLDMLRSRPSDLLRKYLSDEEAQSLHDFLTQLDSSS